ncbi:glycosyltransferase involved in cell wall biosynthesis [Novosphingobium sp. 1529]|uniref:glycosyltransferase n=1 Tax=Novosphingobium sp. 1529 TaxID=3156424 RepID=UPI003395B411
MSARLPRGGWYFAMTHSAPGGLREIWNDVADGLAQRGHVVGRFVLYPDGRGGDGRDAQREGWHHVMQRRRAGPVGLFRLMVALIRWLRSARPAVVVTAMPFANVVVPVAATLARTGTRVVVTHHSPQATHHRVTARLDALSGCLPAVKRIVCVSAAVANSFAAVSRRYRNKLEVIHNALPQHIEGFADELYATLRQTAPIPGRCIAVGRLSHQKNYPQLLHALAAMTSGTLDIVGGGEDEETLRALAGDLGIAHRVNFLGQMSRLDALRQCARAQVFVQVSHYEGHSLALIEAARLGLPLVVSSVPVQCEGITDKAGNLCGQAVALGDPAALAAVLHTLLADDSARGVWAERARRLGLEISSAAMVNKYETLLSRIAA